MGAAPLQPRVVLFDHPDNQEALEVSNALGVWEVWKLAVARWRQKKGVIGDEDNGGWLRVVLVWEMWVRWIVFRTLSRCVLISAV